jgi:hypothetical protein
VNHRHDAAILSCLKVDAVAMEDINNGVNHILWCFGLAFQIAGSAGESCENSMAKSQIFSVLRALLYRSRNVESLQQNCVSQSHTRSH